MKKVIIRTSIFLLLLTTISAGLVYIFRDRLKAHFIPTIEQVGDITIKVENDTCYVSSKLSALNKTSFKIEIDTIKYKVTLFNKTYLKSEKFIGMTLLPKSSDTVDFSLKIPYKILIHDLKEERKKGDSASYSINVFLQYSTFLGKSEMPINKAARLKIPQPPDVEIIEIKYEKIRRKSIHADVKIKIINYSNVDLTIKEMNYSMAILNQGKLKGKHIEQIDIKPNGTTIISLPIEINPKNIARTFFQVMLNKDKYTYTLNLKAILESEDHLKEAYPIDLTKKGEMEIKK